jgi:hypothetical protein
MAALCVKDSLKVTGALLMGHLTRVSSFLQDGSTSPDRPPCAGSASPEHGVPDEHALVAPPEDHHTQMVLALNFIVASLLARR